MDKHPSSACCIRASCAARRRHSTPRPAPAELNPTGVRNLAGILLGLRIPKGTKTSNWAARELTAALESPTPPPTPGPAANCSCASRVWGCCGRIQAPRARRFPGRKGPRHDEERRDLRLLRGTIQRRLARAHMLRRRQISMNLLNSYANSI